MIPDCEQCSGMLCATPLCSFDDALRRSALRVLAAFACSAPSKAWGFPAIPRDRLSDQREVISSAITISAAAGRLPASA